MRDLDTALRLHCEKDYDGSFKIVDAVLKEDPEDVQFLTILYNLMADTGKHTIAYHIAKRCTQIAPKLSGVWMNMGKAAYDLWFTNEAERCYEKALSLTNEDKNKMLIYVNLVASMNDTGRFVEAEPYAQKAYEIDPTHRMTRANLGFCQLAQRKWADGWKNYHACIGHDWRPKTQYQDEPEWDGIKTGKVVLYHEQGLGDMLSFSSMIPDANKRADIIVETMPKLKGLLQRSFPKVKVYDTFTQKGIDWDESDRKINASLPLGQCAEFFRLKDSDFPGTPYLIPDPDRAYMWRSLFAKKGKPVIGIAWSGGVPKTGAKYRQWDLEQLLPLFQSVDAHWVSLQYKSAAKEIAAFKQLHPEIDLVEYPHATLTKDYDDTAALVSALDRVVCMQTAVTHLCGGLGVPCWVFVPQNSQWRYGGDGEDYIWAKSVRIIRQSKRGEWELDIKRVAEELHVLYPGVSAATGKPARKGKLRSDRPKIRFNGQSDHRQAGNQSSA